MKNPKNIKMPKCKNMMYEQQIAHLSFASIAALAEHIEKTLQPKRFAVILHDKDVNDKGQPSSPHIHAMLQFENARSINSIAKLLNDKPQYIEAWHDKSENGFCYLIHATKGAQTKYQYDPSDVIANFDYPAFVANVSKEVKKVSELNGNNRINNVLDLLFDGEIDREKAISMLTGSQYGNAKKKIDDIFALRLEKQAEKWRKEMIEQNKSVKVMWLYGRPGTGKSTLAKKLVKKTGEPFYISGSSRDPFQSYQGEHKIILDELRPTTIPYHDLLRILDPYGLSDSLVYAPSRYNDKALAADLIIVTTPYDPFKYYKEAVSNKETDSFEQLLRRITLVNCLTDKNIYLMEFDTVKSEFKRVDGYVKTNPYSFASRPQKPDTENKELFEKMTACISDTGTTAAPEDDCDINENGIPYQEADDIDINGDGNNQTA